MLKKLATILVSVILTLAAAEAALRLIDYRIKVYPGDPILGTRYAKSATWTEHLRADHKEFVSHTNNQGFFDNEDVEPLKAEGRVRIAMVGDSHTMCVCANDDSFPNRLEALLNEEQPGRFEVMNGGVGGYSPYQYFLKAKLEMVPLDPDHLIVMYYLGNDSLDLVRKDDRPYLTLSESGEIEENSPRFVVYADPEQLDRFPFTSRVFSLVYWGPAGDLRYQITRGRMLLGNALEAGDDAGILSVARYMMEIARLSRIGRGLLTQALHEQVFFRHFPQSQSTSEALDRFVMRSFRDLAASHGIELTYALLPAKVQVEPETMGPVEDALAKSDPPISLVGLGDFLNRKAEKMKSMGREEGVRVVDITSDLKAIAAGRPLYYEFDMHLTLEGNAAVARVLRERLSDLLVVSD